MGVSPGFRLAASAREALTLGFPTQRFRARLGGSSSQGTSDRLEPESEFA